MKLFVVLLLALPSFSFAANCTARGANRTYPVSLDEATRELKVDVDTGARYVATANFSHSVIQNADFWSIPPGFNATGIEFVWDIANQKNWVCLKAGECYVCR